MSGSILQRGIGIPVLMASLLSVAMGTGANAEADRAFNARICMAVPCAGTFGQLEHFRDKQGRLVRILARGDFRVCSHPPAVYYDAQGKTLETIDDWLRVDEARVRAANELHARMTAGLQRAEVISCSDVCKTPSRPDPNDTNCLPP